MQIKSAIIVILMLYGGISIAEEKFTSREDRNIIDRSVNEVSYALVQEMKEKFNLSCNGRGGSMPYDIQKIEVLLLRQEPATIEEARELLVKATEEFVKIINSHESIRPYLRDYPWDHNRARISISIYDNQGRGFPEVGLVFQVHDTIFYYGPERLSKKINDEIKEESYLEAKKIVESSPSVLKPIEKKKKKWFNWF